ncbi:hypothetical protein PENANT_c017G01915 [Penicillium antarcticum]|uniref:Elongator complex protein 6 n=1 Tax=Penicillium antarcticum TaxID=416450 RepID=A0A1V6Q263_9EURO|nr:uncharacterized protein N7508_005303 [Penicillium antarcticum]KAJ5306288.1 hypothetical protein N7508_005303 [Penicillium antarcticum]OQD83378.1 hypothetical protein PENANT_c017G01915 [Penicillium antarcticum]
MPSQPPLPPLLAPYVTLLPESSLTLASSILGATSNWLVLRFLHAALSSPSLNPAFGADETQTGIKKKVVLVSFLRSFDFWKTEAKRLGLDLGRLAEKQQFAFIDGLSELFYAPDASTPNTSPAGLGSSPRTTLPLRSPPGVMPGRGPPPAAAPPRGNISVTRAQAEPGIAKKLHFTGRGLAALDLIEKNIIAVIEQQKSSVEEIDELVLILDQPDLLLAATGPTMGIGATEIAEWVTGLQQHAHATVLTLATDAPLIHNASVSAGQPATPIETEHATFAIGLAHRARSVMQLRTLETGAAKDVSGVLRISRGGGWSAGEEESWEEKEVLYFIQRDGGVSVFGRGES